MSAAAAAPPNFVFILAEDQAWNGLSKRLTSLAFSTSQTSSMPNRAPPPR